MFRKNVGFVIVFVRASSSSLGGAVSVWIGPEI
jgi:hypothetical protein